MKFKGNKSFLSWKFARTKATKLQEQDCLHMRVQNKKSWSSRRREFESRGFHKSEERNATLQKFHKSEERNATLQKLGTLAERSKAPRSGFFLLDRRKEHLGRSDRSGWMAGKGIAKKRGHLLCVICW